MDITPNQHLSSNTLWKQPVAGDLRLEPGSMQLIERWKGQYTHCQNVLRNMYVSGDIDYSRFTAVAGTLVQAYATPLPPSGFKWILAQGTVDEIEAGENGVLQTIWNASLSSEDEFPVISCWTLDWQPENYDPYSYCSNVSAHVDPGQIPLKSQRVAVEQCLHPPIGNNVMTNARLFQNDQGVVSRLNENEQKILKWKLEDKHVVLHHPVMTRKVTVSKVAAKSLEQAMEQYRDLVVSADMFDSTPADQAALMGLGAAYRWTSRGTSIQATQPDASKSEWRLDYSTQWVGSLSAVPEFYSDDPSERWKFGEM